MSDSVLCLLIVAAMLPAILMFVRLTFAGMGLWYACYGEMDRSRPDYWAPYYLPSINQIWSHRYWHYWTCEQWLVLARSRRATQEWIERSAIRGWQHARY